MRIGTLFMLKSASKVMATTVDCKVVEFSDHRWLCSWPFPGSSSFTVSVCICQVGYPVVHTEYVLVYIKCVIERMFMSISFGGWLNMQYTLAVPWLL